MRLALAVALLALVGACGKSRSARVIEALEVKGFSEVEVTQKNRATFGFTGVREGVDCEGTAEVKQDSGGYAGRFEVEADWMCR